MRDNLIRHIQSKGVYDRHAAETIAHDVLMKTKAKGVEFKEANFRILDYFRTRNRESDRYDSLDYTSEEGTSQYETLPYDPITEKEAALQESQRQLISELVDGSDERTKLIVQTFLETDKPTVRNVAKRLNLHHATVSTRLKKLSHNFVEAEDNRVEDYLYA